MDSGSEVSVTATEQLISELKLEYLQNIESRGVHAVADKPTYKGVLKLGKEEIEVEVWWPKCCFISKITSSGSGERISDLLGRFTFK